jgi:hypothetical protein
MNMSSGGIKDDHQYDVPDETTPYKGDEEPDIDDHDQMDMELEADQDSNENDSNDDNGNFSDDGDDGNLMIMEEDEEPMAKKSIYMTEKTSKKKMLKDGKVIIDLFTEVMKCADQLLLHSFFDRLCLVKLSARTRVRPDLRRICCGPRIHANTSPVRIPIMILRRCRKGWAKCGQMCLKPKSIIGEGVPNDWPQKCGKTV